VTATVPEQNVYIDDVPLELVDETGAARNDLEDNPKGPIFDPTARIQLNGLLVARESTLAYT